MKYAIGLEKKYTKQTILPRTSTSSAWAATPTACRPPPQQYFGVTAAELTVAAGREPDRDRAEPDQERARFEPENYAANQASPQRHPRLHAHASSYITEAQYKTAIATKVDDELRAPPEARPRAASTRRRIPVRLRRRGQAASRTARSRRSAPTRPSRSPTGSAAATRSTSPSTRTCRTPRTRSSGSARRATRRASSSVPRRSPSQVGTGRILVMAQNKDYNNTRGTPAISDDLGQLRRRLDLRRIDRLPARIDLQAVHPARVPRGRSRPQRVLQRRRPLRCRCPRSQTAATAPWGGPAYKFKNDSDEQGSYDRHARTARSVNSVFVQMGTKVDQCDTRKIAAVARRASGRRVPPTDRDLETNPACVDRWLREQHRPDDAGRRLRGDRQPGRVLRADHDRLAHRPARATTSRVRTRTAVSPPVSPDVANAAAYAMAGVMRPERPAPRTRTTARRTSARRVPPTTRSTPGWSAPRPRRRPPSGSATSRGKQAMRSDQGQRHPGGSAASPHLQADRPGDRQVVSRAGHSRARPRRC